MAARVLGKDAHIAIAGAGSIGCFVGGLLLHGGRRVSFLGRPRIAEELAKYGLRLSDLSGHDICVAAKDIAISTDPAILACAELVIVTVKSQDTEAIARILADHAPPAAMILSLQNGVRNVPALRSSLGKERVLGGMTPYNVVHRGEGHFHRGTSGRIVIEKEEMGVASLLSAPGLAIGASKNIENVQWGKLALNLNNALNALSGAPLRQQLGNRDSRALLADQIEEAIRVFDAAGITPDAPLPVPLRFLPRILRLPDSLFRLAANRMLRIDPEARSSMWEDLRMGRPTEIDFLQGEIAGLAAHHGVEVPLTAEIIRLIREAEARSHLGTTL